MTPAEKLLAALGNVRDEWVLAAAPADLLPGEGGSPAPKRAPAGKAVWLRWGGLAACAALVCLAGWRLAAPNGGMSTSSTATDTAAAGTAETSEEAGESSALYAEDALPAESAEEDGAAKSSAEASADWRSADGAALAAMTGTATDLPLLSLGEDSSGGMGFEGYLAYSLDELDCGSPWLAATEAERAALTALPVYATDNWNEYCIPLSLSETEMCALADQAAAALGVAVTQVQAITVAPGNPLPDDAVYSLEAATSGAYTIEVSGNGVVTVWGKEGTYRDIDAALPAQYSFTYSDTTPAQAAETLDYLLEEYAAFAGLQNPVHAIFADRNIYGERDVSYHAYEGSGTLAEQIVNYSLRQVQFAPNDDGRLMLIRKYDLTAGATLLGDYPLLTAGEAAALLANGNYTTSVPYTLTETDAPARVELLYRSGETLMPYYRFLVELPESFLPSGTDGLLNYGAYYVPAVRPEYLTALPVWDGSFN